MLKNNTSQIWLIDTQEAFKKAILNWQETIASIKLTLDFAKLAGIPVSVSEQYPQGLGKTTSELAEGIKNAKVFEKDSFSIAGDEKIQNEIESLSRDQIILIGIETPVCVMQSALDLKRLNYQVHVLADACGSRREFDQKIALDRMANEGVTISSVEIMCYEIIKSIKNPILKPTSKMVRNRENK